MVQSLNKCSKVNCRKMAEAVYVTPFILCYLKFIHSFFVSSDAGDGSSGQPNPGHHNHQDQNIHNPTSPDNRNPTNTSTLADDNRTIDKRRHGTDY